MPRFPGFPPSWYRRLPKRAQAAVIALCVLALAGISLGVYVPVNDHLNRPCMRKGATIVTHQGENGDCIGFTDGSYPFDSRLKDVERKVRSENWTITEKYPKDYVSVVLLLPISADKGSIMSMANAIEQVRGAYTAQHYANRDNVEGNTPYIQLLIGNDGYQANEWDSAVTTIIDRASSQHIAAVTGLGLSLDGTEKAVRKLTSRDIPAFGATITSDTYDNIKDFVRASPSNVDNAAAALSYVEADFSRAVLVEDGNAGDSYDATLVSGFRKFSALAHHQIVGVEPYDTTERDRPGQSKAAQAQAQREVATRISQMTVDICAQQPAVVLFAGRGQDLGVLLHAFSNTCLDKPITIISGDDVTNLPDTAQLRHDLAGHVTVDYAGVAHPDEWASARDPRTARAEAEGVRGFQTFDAVFQKLFPGGSLTDSNTMMAYDATLTGVSAIRLTEQRQPRADAVANELGALQGAHKVLGASGPIQFTANYQTSDTGSNPVSKPIPIIRLRTNGHPQVLTVTWPRKSPPVH